MKRVLLFSFLVSVCLFLSSCSQQPNNEAIKETKPVTSSDPIDNSAKPLSPKGPLALHNIKSDTWPDVGGPSVKLGIVNGCLMNVDPEIEVPVVPVFYSERVEWNAAEEVLIYDGVSYKIGDVIQIPGNEVSSELLSEMIVPNGCPSDALFYADDNG